MDDLKQFADYTGSYLRVLWVDGRPWRVWRHVMEPVGMPHAIGPVDARGIRRAMRGTGAALARWNEQWDTPPCDWWWVCCDDAKYDVERLPRRARRDVRAGLRRCQARRIEIDWFAQNGYEMFASAYARYGSAQPQDRESFAAQVHRFAAYAGHELWGVFAGEQLAGYAVCVVLQNAVNISSLKADPSHLKACPNNALVYELTRHYLVDRGVHYVTDGSRVVQHETSFQGFLERMGYRRVYCPLKAVFSAKARAVLASGLDRWGRRVGLARLAPGLMSGIEAAGQLRRIARMCADPGRREELAAQAAAERASDDKPGPENKDS